MASTTKLSIIKGDDITLNFDFNQSDGTAYDITGYTVFLTVKENKEDTDANALISKTWTSHSNPTGGITAVSLTNDDTDVDPGIYHFDVQIKSGGGVISSIASGKFQVTQDITRRES